MKRANLTTFTATLQKNRLYVFSRLDLTRLFGWSNTSVQFLLHRYSKTGVVIQLRKGLYYLANSPVSQFYIANRLVEPSYVSLESALSFHHVIPETAYTVTSVTTKTTKSIEALGQHYAFHSIKKTAYGGYTPVEQDGQTVLVACPEKALADYCYLVTKGIKQPLDRERLRLDRLDSARLKAYVEGFKSVRLNQIIAELLTV